METSQARKHGATDRLLLAAQMILEKLVPRDIASVYAGNSVVHQQLRIELRHAGCSRNRSKTLTKVVAPLRQRCSILLLLEEMP